MTATPSLQRTAARFAIPRTLAAGFLVAALATLVIAAVNYRSAETRADAVRAMDRASLAMRQLNLFNASIKDAETGQRGYLLTGDVAYLQPYETAVADMQQHLDRLKAQAEDLPSHQQLVTQLDGLHRQKLRELNQTIALRRAGDLDGAMALVNGGEGKNIMDRVRDTVEALRTQQTELLDTRRQQWVDAASNDNLYSAGGSLLLLVLICISAWSTAREYRRRALEAWVSAGLNGLSQRIQGDHRLEELGPLALEYLATYLMAPVGAGYVAEPDGSFTLFGGYAVPRERLQQTVLPGEGLVGQAARSRAMVHVRDVPGAYLQVSSSTGQSAPAEVLIAPAVENRRVFAVIELGFYRAVGDAERNLMERASEMLAVAVRSAIDRNRLQDLLEETQRQSEELQTQQEELRVNNEELEQQSRVLQESQAQMEVQQTELEQTNAHLEEQTQQLEYQREQMLRAQSALTDKARELELASEYKSEFLANMSHELRTPLNGMLGMLSLLESTPVNAQQDDYIQTAQRSAKHLLSLLNDILDASALESGKMTLKPESVDLPSLVSDVQALMRPVALEKRLVLSVKADKDLPRWVMADGTRVKQIMLNLVSNALK
uniref:CHASE3 domain-containing protein n=1 Tax=Acidovorax sp. TaxID=1872122 RepID=UPI0026203565